MMELLSNSMTIEDAIAYLKSAAKNDLNNPCITILTEAFKIFLGSKPDIHEFSSVMHKVPLTAGMLYYIWTTKK